ncbi:MAG: DMT family transporter [Actinomycetota bacterium]|nr:DMT family transporter [Actinomycetota bacterium]
MSAATDSIPKRRPLRLSPIARLRNGRRSAGLVWFALIGISVLWGTMGIATQVALREGISPYTLTTLRMTMASAVLLVYLAGTRKRVRLSRHVLGDGFVMALGQVVLPSVLFAEALEHLAAGAASLLFALVPAATALWMLVAGPASALGGRAGLGVSTALAGAVLVAFNSTRGGTGGSSVLGVGLILAAVLVTSFHGVYSKRHSTHSLFDVIAPQILIGTIILLASGTLGRAIEWRGLSLVTWGIVAYLAVGVTVLPTIALSWLFKHTSAMKVALVNYLFPLVAIVVEVLWFGERFSGSLTIGGIVLLVGVAILEAGEGVRYPNEAGLRPCPDLGGVRVAGRRSAPLLVVDHRPGSAAVRGTSQAPSRCSPRFSSTTTMVLARMSKAR